MTSNLELTKWVYQQTNKWFSNAFPKSATDLMGKESILLARGNQHTRLRKLIAGPFSTEKLVGFTGTVDKLARQTMDSWRTRDKIVILDEAKKVRVFLIVLVFMTLFSYLKNNPMWFVADFHNVSFVWYNEPSFLRWLRSSPQWIINHFNSLFSRRIFNSILHRQFLSFPTSHHLLSPLFQKVGLTDNSSPVWCVAYITLKYVC